MRDYRIVAEPRTEPDLHKLAQLFIGMAFARADAEREARHDLGSPKSDPPRGRSREELTVTTGWAQDVGGRWHTECWASGSPACRLGGDAPAPVA